MIIQRLIDQVEPYYIQRTLIYHLFYNLVYQDVVGLVLTYLLILEVS